jgi:hypothetical protein
MPVKPVSHKPFKTVVDELKRLHTSQYRIGVLGSNYRCDAALAAKAVLSAVNYVIFCDIWLNRKIDESKITVERANGIKVRCSQEFSRRTLTNIHQYHS